MTALAELGWRLVRAGGRFRVWIVVVGNAVATTLLLATAAMPAALYPAGVRVNPDERANVTAILVFSLVPAVVLLLTANRTSAAVRDRRLASLRMLGLSRGRTIAVGAIEGGLLGLLGAIAGLILFLGVAPLVEKAVAAGPEWFRGLMTTTPVTAGLVMLVAVVLSAGTAAVSLVRSTRNPMAERSEATARRPSLWRLAVLGAAVVLLGGISQLGERIGWMRGDAALPLLLGGALAGALAIAFVTPLVCWWLAGLMVRTGRVAPMLAGRGIQVEPGGTSRLVAGLGVAVYLVLAALSVLTAFASTPQYEFARQSIQGGPQVIDVWHPQDEASETHPPVTSDELTSLAAVPGVIAVIPQHGLEIEGWCGLVSSCVVEPFVGTCAELNELMTVAGCRDDQAAAVVVGNYEGTAQGWAPDLGGIDRATEISIRFSQAGTVVALELTAPLVQDSAATQERWVYQSGINLFIPRAVAEAAGAEPTFALLVADGGVEVQQAVIDAAPPGLEVWTYPIDDYAAVIRIRVVVMTLSALVIGVGLLSLGTAAADRAVARRRAVARHVAIGVPARVLRTAQFQQTVVPLVIAVVLAAALGALVTRAFAALSGWPPLADGVQLGLVAASSLVGALLVAAATLPTISTRIRPELLRRE